MSATGGLGTAVGTGGTPQFRGCARFELNARATMATLLRPPRGPVAWPSSAQLLIGAVLAVAVVVATMMRASTPGRSAMPAGCRAI